MSHHQFKKLVSKCVPKLKDAKKKKKEKLYLVCKKMKCP